ncbi:hypothetical protein [Geomonas sp.]|uniref:hypothetical protein n=1 Tax=Geomonas sp. TaxID=2651584 RepID=UPI002B49025C|nr:hypothetical protein [Geomonas sp.]HJV34539.1 hypothetical protein [Geomonas sp.]
MKRHHAWERAVSGTLAGLAGTVLIQGVQAAGMKYLPQHMPPIRQHPGEFIVEKTEDALKKSEKGARAVGKIPEAVEKAVAQALGVGYGLTFALLLAATRRRVRHVVAEGSAIGLATWAAGYLGWLPATKLMPPVTRQKPVQVIGGIASHLAFGVLTAALYRELRRRL